MSGFVGGNVATLARAGEDLARVGQDVEGAAKAVGGALARSAGAVGHRVAAAALDGAGATWCSGLSLLALQVAAVAALATTGAADLGRVDR